MNIETAILAFAECAAGNHEAIWLEANARKANRFADGLTEAMEHIQSHGDPGRDALMPLLFDPRPAVRVSAACYLLRHCTPEAMAVLKREAAGSGIPSILAEVTMQRWKDGTWALDPR